MNPYLQYMYSYPHKTAYGPLDGVNLTHRAQDLSGGGHSLYLHLPFCQTKCGYCNLFSVTGQSKDDVDRYLAAVKRQIAQYSEILDACQTKFSAFTMGGGTPLFLDERQLEQTFAMAESRLRFGPEPEKAVETAPNQTDRGKLELLKQFRITRISMGVQSFSDRELRTLLRRHSAQKAREALALLKSYSFPCVNLDFIYGIPGQTVDSLLDTLKEALTFAPDELFLYPLYIKHGARLQRHFPNGTAPQPKLAFLQYREASQFLRSEGFRQISMRRFVRKGPGGVSDCGFSSSLALGCGGRSYLGNLHFCSPYAITQKECLKQIRQYETVSDFTSIQYGIFLSAHEEKRRYVIRHLFIYPGLHLENYRRNFGSRALTDFPLLEKWTQDGYCRMSDGFLAMTEKGLGLSDWLGPQLISPHIRRRMNEWEALHG